MNLIWLRGLAAPAMIMVLALAVGLIDGVTAALTVVAVGALAIIVWHLLQLDALARWASGPIEVPVPEGRGTWALAYAALYHRVRLRSARQRDLRLALDRFVSGARALPEGVVVLGCQRPHRMGESPRRSASGPRPQARQRRADRQPRPPPGIRAVPRRGRLQRAGSHPVHARKRSDAVACRSYLSASKKSC